MAQKIVILAGALAVALMVIVPPWQWRVSTNSQPLGYAPIFMPPTRTLPKFSTTGISGTFESQAGVQLDTQRMYAQIVGVVIVTGAVAFILRSKPPARA